nr:hypothetical protein [Tanacetum cinerariifolium]
MALISLSFKKIFKPTNNNLRTSSNTNRAHQDNTSRINKGTEYDNQKVVNVAGPRENVNIQVVQQFRIQCYNCKEYGHVSRECHKPKRSKDAAYHKEDMLLCKQKEAGFQLNADQANWKDDTDDEPDDQKLEVQNDNDNYNVFSIDKEHPEQPELVNETYLEETKCDLLASLIEKLKCEIDDNKNRNKVLESSNKALVDKLKCEIKDFKTKNKSLESSNNHFKEANNEPSKTNQLMFKDLRSSKLNLIAHESDETIRLAHERQSKLSDLIKPFDYKNLNNLYDLFVPQREKSPEQRYFSERETVGSTMVQKSGIQCYNCKEFWHVTRECQKLKREKDAAYHREKMMPWEETGKVKQYLGVCLAGKFGS